MVYYKITRGIFLKNIQINLFTIINYNNELYELVLKHYVYIAIL